VRVVRVGGRCGHVEASVVGYQINNSVDRDLAYVTYFDHFAPAASACRCVTWPLFRAFRRLGERVQRFSVVRLLDGLPVVAQVNRIAATCHQALGACRKHICSASNTSRSAAPSAHRFKLC
jgi:hypothetical protein